MSSLNQIRLADGTQLNLSEWLHWPLYSTVEAANTDAIRLNAFNYVKGQTVPHTQSLAARQATQSDTNMVRPGKMNQDEAQVVFAITYEMFGIATLNGGSPAAPVALEPLVAATALRRLQEETVVELKVGANIKKPQVEVPFSYIGQGIGQHMAVTGDFANINIGTGGCPTPRNQRQLNLPVYIGGFGESARPGNSMAFHLTWRSTAAVTFGQDVRVRWWLDGLRKRPA